MYPSMRICPSLQGGAGYRIVLKNKKSVFFFKKFMSRNSLKNMVDAILVVYSLSEIQYNYENRNYDMLAI